MSANDLLKELATLDIRLSANGDKLKVDGPQGALTPEVRELLSHHKVELLRVLSEATIDQPIRVISVRSHRMPAQCLFDTCDETLTQLSPDEWCCPTCGGRWRLVGPDLDDSEAKPAARATLAQRLAVKAPLAVNGFPAQCPACNGAINLQDKATAWCAACRILFWE